MAMQAHLNLQHIGLSRRVTRHIFIPLPPWASWPSATHTITQLFCSPNRTQDRERTQSPSKSTAEFYISLNSQTLWVLTTLLESFSNFFSSGQILVWETVCFFSVSPLLFSVEGGFRDTAMWLGPDKKNQHHPPPKTPIPALGSEHIHGVSQLIPGREHPRDEVPFGSAWWNYRKQSGLTENPSFSSSTRRIHGRTLNQHLHIIEPQFSLP